MHILTSYLSTAAQSFKASILILFPAQCLGCFTLCSRAADEATQDVSVLGVFSDNHDNPRFLFACPDLSLYRNALNFVLTTVGYSNPLLPSNVKVSVARRSMRGACDTAHSIPIIYYGTEQAYAGGNDPQCRESLWYNAIVSMMQCKSIAH